MSDPGHIPQKKRSLILAGGGMKVAFQAGVLQVWLDEAGLTFEHADGTSGGTLNLAMYCQGMNGTQIANNWRNMSPRLGIDFDWEQYPKLFYAESLLTLDRFMENVFPGWVLDWDRIRSAHREGTFNVYNFSEHKLEVLTPDMMTEDYLIACIALPMWFPAVRINGNTYIDSVFVTDANLEEAVRRGADELWVIWTVSERGEWRHGFIETYFQMVETSANAQFRMFMKRIEENNVVIAEGGMGEFGRHIDTKVLKAEVPLHYIINLNPDRIAEAVNSGVQAARNWCVEQGILLSSADGHQGKDPTKLQFTEEMKGYVTFGATNYSEGFWQGREDGTSLMFHLDMKVDDVDKFVTDPAHEARAEGYVGCEQLGGKLPVEKGAFNLFVNERDPSRKHMLYRLHFRDGADHPLTLSGVKYIKDDPGADLWADTTTLFTRIFSGHVGPDDEARAEIVASGIVRIHLSGFLKELTTFRVQGPTAADRASALTRFGVLFLGKLWDVYARRILSSSPF